MPNISYAMFLAADFKLQKNLNLSSQRASLINILLPSREMSRSSVLIRILFDLDSSTFLTIEADESRIAILLFGYFDCSTGTGENQRGRARIISGIVIDGNKAVKTAKATFL